MRNIAPQNRKIEKNNLTYDLAFEFIFLVLSVLAIVTSIYFKSTDGLFSSVLMFITILIPKFIIKKSRVKIPSLLYFLILLFIFLSMFLGKVSGFYGIFPWWDKMLHTLSGVILMLIGFVIFFLLCGKDVRKEIPPIVIVLFGLFFAVAMAGVWEIFEFTTDKLFGLNSQNGSLVDTMGDIIVGTLGAIAASIPGYLYLKGKRIRFFEKMIDYMIKENPHIIK